MHENGGGRRLMTVVAVTAALAAVPAGVAIAAGSGSSDEGSAAKITRSVQSTAPDRGGGDRGDCPEKRDGGQGSAEL